ncbi:MAG: hypothetical protein ACU85E_05325 [Gammaproteobacteria bacterium]
MGFGTILKLLLFLLWPVLLLFLYYLADKEGFKRRLAKIKKDSFKK